MQNHLPGESVLLRYLNEALSKRLENLPPAGLYRSSPNGLTPEEAECMLSRLDYGESFVPDKSESLPGGEDTFAACLEQEFPLLGLRIIARRFMLQELETKLLLVLTALEMDETYRDIIGCFEEKRRSGYPRLAGLLAVWCNSRRECRKHLFGLTDYPFIARYGLAELLPSPGEHERGESELRLAPGALHFILGTGVLCRELQEYGTLIPHKPLNSPAAELLSRAALFTPTAPACFYFLLGPRGTGKKEYALELAGYLGRDLLVISTPTLMAAIAAGPGQSYPDLLYRFKRSLKSILLTASLHNLLIYFDRFDALFTHDQYHLLEKHLEEIISNFNISVLGGSPNEWSPRNLSSLGYLKKSFSRPDYQTSRALWEAGLKPYGNAPELAADLANMFSFSGHEIERIMTLAKESLLEGPEALFALCRETIRTGLKESAQLVTHSYTMEDIILPPGQLNLLKDFINYWNNRHQVLDEWGFNKRTQGRGVTALFTGPPGTGKTMAAGIVASALNLQLYRIELSQLVSKYIGETEKNLARIFDSAEGGGVMLLFDEADAIFGKRSAVNDSHDRYANLEVSYLLQKIENYHGPVVLTTNFLKNIDEAFMRRIQFIVEFNRPDQEQSRRIWEKVFPSQAPLANSIDFTFLVEKFKFTGANIRNIALGSAFYAAEERAPRIGMPHIISALKGELKKTGKMCSPGDFGPYWVED